jgi:chromosomal replication initiator protein
VSTTALDLASYGKAELWGDFVALPENRLGLVAARRLVQALAKRSSFPNPLYLHGAAGTGKSHLAKSILEKCIARTPELSAQLISTQELLPSSTEPVEGHDQLRPYLDADLLVIEGLQYLPDRSVNNLIRVLDERKASRKATVTTASVGPGLLKQMPARLTSRLASGLVVQLAPLPFPSRRILAEKLTTRRKVYLTADALDLLAADPTGGGIRPMIGTIEQLLKLVDHDGQILDAREVQSLLNHGPQSELSFCENVIRKVATAFNITTKELLGPRRHKAILRPRQVAMFLARKVGKLSYPQIGQAFSGRDHTTVLHACEMIATTMKTDLKLKQMVKDLQSELG